MIIEFDKWFRSADVLSAIRHPSTPAALRAGLSTLPLCLWFVYVLRIHTTLVDYAAHHVGRESRAFFVGEYSNHQWMTRDYIGVVQGSDNLEDSDHSKCTVVTSTSTHWYRYASR